MRHSYGGCAALGLGALIIADAALLAALLSRFADEAWREIALQALAALMLVYLIIELRTVIRFISAARHKRARHVDALPATLTLVSADEAELRHWELQGRVGLVIGRSLNGDDVDVDLSGTEYFSLISDCHAVLNYTEKGWYLADAGSKNGTAVIRRNGRQRLRLSPGEPVRIDIGDTIILAEETALAVR